ncbi:protein of unknown function [Cupriavidus taiwanensis]|uniref:Uncharacterized protein n=1 Tax=Cupriavidus taiwanensis TaxID=164546 RepID=A0A7Z7JCN1_9BURK|nr:protein of unknown function [Cupriavidus taiwanensis]SOZ06170.1 hypothetical protein CBM2595_A80855 [Cupriavidus taiwanensis]SOZ08152.1 hypothetical protein CBM2597_A90758 [Cupriavidus taiwanensis]SPC18699.1 hypothetical protein CBM2594_A80138 [Cupriavidus taiwanensis]SPD40997.1 protein of unknown function [Cupriavidus taiwanensis]
MFESRTTHQYYEGPVAQVTGPFCIVSARHAPMVGGAFN